MAIVSYDIANMQLWVQINCYHVYFSSISIIIHNVFQSLIWQISWCGLSSIYIQEIERYAIDIAYEGNMMSNTSDDDVILFVSNSNPGLGCHEHWLKSTQRYQKYEKISSQIMYATFYHNKRRRYIILSLYSYTSWSKLS